MFIISPRASSWVTVVRGRPSCNYKVGRRDDRSARGGTTVTQGEAFGLVYHMVQTYCLFN